MSPYALRSTRASLAASVLICGICTTSQAQAITASGSTPQSAAPPALVAASDSPVVPVASSSSNATDALPEAPAPQPGIPAAAQTPQSGNLSASTPPAPEGQHPVAPLHAKFIPAGYRAQPINGHDKVLVGLGDLYSVENFAAIVLSAGYEQVLNSEPNYGTDKGAFGERVGAAAIRETTQGIFSDMVFAPLLHEDNRYYQKGPQFNPVKRTVYAVTRPLITRTDSGKTTVNGSLLLGYAAAAALTPAYYPQSNRNFHDTASTFGGSIGGAALGFFVDEFSSDVLIALHLKHNP
ncbi:MAG TPA: hypothetical protein VKV02_09535 [Acidobacteriaceae bacterium]|nr:hypothetical protein [Acidobacteriaceae bacterium]